MARFPEVDVVVSFASSRSVFDSTKEMFTYPQLRTIAIIAEGVPERRTRQLIARAAARQPPLLLIGPATVGGIKAGAFRIGNTGGMLDNIMASKLYRSDSVAYVSRSGGLSNELNNIIARCTDGLYEGIAIGGDRYPGLAVSAALCCALRPTRPCRCWYCWARWGGDAEYAVARALEDGRFDQGRWSRGARA
jgi:ATP citrate (pro-S)-lyase